MKFVFLLIIIIFIVGGNIRENFSIQAARNACTANPGWRPMWTNQRQNAIICTKNGINPGNNCNRCDTWRLYVAKDGGCDMSPPGGNWCPRNKAGNYYCGHSPCRSGDNYPWGGTWTWYPKKQYSRISNCKVQNKSTCTSCIDGYNLTNNTCTKQYISSKNVPGPAGDKGEQGLQGPQGPQGPQGIRGRDANVGDVGWRGPTGIQGDTGARGAKGHDGSTGSIGHRGLQGPQGETTIIDPWTNTKIIRSLKKIYDKITKKNKKLLHRKNPPINLNITMGHLGKGKVEAIQRGEDVPNPARVVKEDLTLLEGFSTF